MCIYKIYAIMHLNKNVTKENNNFNIALPVHSWWNNEGVIWTDKKTPYSNVHKTLKY